MPPPSVKMVEDGRISELLKRKHLFRADVVFLPSKPQVLGSVRRYIGDPAPAHSEQHSARGAHAIAGNVFAQVLWLNQTEPVDSNVAKLCVVDRKFVHGGAVRQASSPSGQMGKVVDMTVLVDVQLPNGAVVHGIDSTRLDRVRSFATGDMVVKGSWTGRVVGVEESVTLEFPDWSQCRIETADPVTLYPVPPTSLDHSKEFLYYPGQKVRAVSPRTFGKATWLTGTFNAWTPTQDPIVLDVHTALVIVDWKGNRHRDSKRYDSGVPDDEQSPKAVAALIPFPHAQWCLGDRCMLPKVAAAARIVNIRTQVDVLWQNGHLSRAIPSPDLIHVQPSAKNQFWPRQQVQERGTDTIGLVKSVDSQKRTALVLWMKSGAQVLVRLNQLAEHVQGELGDIVSRLPPGRRARSGSKPRVQQQPWAGYIRGFTEEGDMEVTWMDGSRSTVKPHEVKIHSQLEDDSDSSSSGSESDDGTDSDLDIP